jgi:hypothetical protein
MVTDRHRASRHPVSIDGIKIIAFPRKGQFYEQAQSNLGKVQSVPVLLP